MMSFFGCFGTSKAAQKRDKNAHIANSLVPNPEHNVGKQYNAVNQTVGDANQDLLSKPVNRTLAESSHKEEEPLSLEAHKKVAVDSNTQERTHLSSYGAPEISEQNEIEVNEDITQQGRSSLSSENGSTCLDSYQDKLPKKLTPIVFTLLPSSVTRLLKANLAKHREIRSKSGALTASTLPRTSPKRESPNDKPLVGAVRIPRNNSNDRTPVADSSSSSSFKDIPDSEGSVSVRL